MEKQEIISLAHGSGGLLYHRMVENIFVPAFDNVLLRSLNDSAVCDVSGSKIAMTTDSFVVQPRFFPGGDIGRLAVCGTVNDLSVSGARPLYLTCAMIIEAGFAVSELRRICESMSQAAREAGVMIVTGDTKVVEKGGCDGIFINTAGVGVFDSPSRQLTQMPLSGDALIVSGNIAEHGMAVMAARNKFDFSPPLVSDVAPLNGLIDTLLTAVPDVRALRDATRGGIAAVANEWVGASGCNIDLIEEALPLHPHTVSACELLGVDPLHVANEGKFMAAVSFADANKAVAALQQHPLGRNSTIIGRVGERGGRVTVNTPYGARRIIDMPEGDQLPRIC